MQKNLAANIATITGGETATFDKQHSIDDDLAILSTHIRNRYLLTFQPASPKPGLHKLEVRLPQHPELTISARTNYWAAEPEPSPPNKKGAITGDIKLRTSPAHRIHIPSKIAESTLR